MKKTIVYEVNEAEFRGLKINLQFNGYKLHKYRDNSVFTIDDGTSCDFDQCAAFASFTLPKPGECYANIRVRDSDLSEIIDSHFEEIK